MGAQRCAGPCSGPCLPALSARLAAAEPGLTSVSRQSKPGHCPERALWTQLNRRFLSSCCTRRSEESGQLTQASLPLLPICRQGLPESPGRSTCSRWARRPLREPPPPRDSQPLTQVGTCTDWGEPASHHRTKTKHALNPQSLREHFMFAGSRGSPRCPSAAWRGPSSEPGPGTGTAPRRARTCSGRHRGACSTKGCEGQDTIPTGTEATP